LQPGRSASGGDFSPHRLSSPAAILPDDQPDLPSEHRPAKDLYRRPLERGPIIGADGGENRGDDLLPKLQPEEPAQCQSRRLGGTKPGPASLREGRSHGWALTRKLPCRVQSISLSRLGPSESRLVSAIKIQPSHLADGRRLWGRIIFPQTEKVVRVAGCDQEGCPLVVIPGTIYFGGCFQIEVRRVPAKSNLACSGQSH